MTIAAGMFSVRGVVLASDTKESYGETHTYVDKITPIYGSKCISAIASSGGAYLLDYFTPHIVELVRGNISSYDEMQHQLQDLMVRLYKNDGVLSYPKDSSSDLLTQFLIATKHENEENGELFVINSTLVTRKRLGAVIGCGPLREFGDEVAEAGFLTLERAKVAALSVVHEAKRRYSDVGGRVVTFTITNDMQMTSEDSTIQAAKEQLLDSIRQWQHEMTILTLDGSIDTKEYNRLLNHLLYYFRVTHKEAARIEKDAMRKRIAVPVGQMRALKRKVARQLVRRKSKGQQ